MVEYIEIPSIADHRGALTFLQEGKGLPFRPKRVSWFCNADREFTQAGRAFKSQSELIFSLHGEVTLAVQHPGHGMSRYRLDSSNHGLLIPPMTWYSLELVSADAVILHLADSAFDASDCVRDFGLYLSLRQP